MIKIFHTPLITVFRDYCKNYLFPLTKRKKRVPFKSQMAKILALHLSLPRIWIPLIAVNLFIGGIFAVEESVPLLRVFPIYRKEECEWAIRWDICLSCMRQGEKYAQKIYFNNDGTYRIHGCFHPNKGFYPLENKDSDSKN